jgi:hypothetical protein
MIFNTKATQKKDSQKLTDIFLPKGKSSELWSELDETSQAAVSGGNISLANFSFVDTQQGSTSVITSKFSGNDGSHTKNRVLRSEGCEAGGKSRRKEPEEVFTNMRCSREDSQARSSGTAFVSPRNLTVRLNE